MKLKYLNRHQVFTDSISIFTFPLIEHTKSRDSKNKLLCYWDKNKLNYYVYIFFWNSVSRDLIIINNEPIKNQIRSLYDHNNGINQEFVPNFTILNSFYSFMKFLNYFNVSTTKTNSHKSNIFFLVRKNILLPIVTNNGTTTHSKSPFINCQPLVTGQQVFWFKGTRLLNFPGIDQVSSADTNGKVVNDTMNFIFNTNSSFNGTYNCFGKNMHRTFDVSYCK